MSRPQSTSMASALLVNLLMSVVCAGQDVNYIESSVGLDEPSLEGGATELEFGDVNGDGHVDIVSVGDHGSPFINTDQHGIMVWFGDGKGAWSLSQYGNFGYGGIALGDVNNDGALDAGYGIHHNYSGNDLGDQILEVALGDGTGTNWTAWDDGLATNGETWGMFGTDFADVDNDGDLDVGSISFGCCAGVHVYRNNGDGTWTQTWGFLGGNASALFRFGDFNGDGNADFAAAHGNGTVYLGDGAGGFTLHDDGLSGSSYRRGIGLGDVNGDGRDDLAFVTNPGVAVYTLNQSDTWQDLSGSFANVGDAAFVQITDMNVDGHGDVVALYEGEIVIYTGNGSGTWTTAAEIATADACDLAALRSGADVDHNGKPDFAFVAEENCSPFTGGANQLHLYRETSEPSEPAVHVVHPLEHETWRAGSVRFVDWWSATPGDGGKSLMTIELSTVGPDGPWSTIAQSVPDNGRFQWLISGDTAQSSDCHVRLTMTFLGEPAVESVAGPFTISNPDYVLPGDIDGDNDVDIKDLLMLLGAWGPCAEPENCPADLDWDGKVGVSDLLFLLDAWGAPG